jgi:hypothetical protein
MQMLNYVFEVTIQDCLGQTTVVEAIAACDADARAQVNEAYTAAQGYTVLCSELSAIH